MIKVFEKEEVFDIIYDCLIGKTNIHHVCFKLKEYGYVDDQETSKESLKKCLNSEYIEKYKLTENEIIELKYFKSIGAEKVFYNICHWSCHTCEDAYVDLKQNYQCLDNSNTYQIEEILNNREVVEWAI